MKQCIDCEEVKPSTEFYRKTANKDGLQGRCKACDGAYPRNPEKRRASTRKWCLANPERRRAYDREWYAANTERARATDREWRFANPEKVRASSRKYYEANPEKSRARGRKRRAADPEKHRSESRTRVSKWRAANPEAVRLQVHRRRARKLANGVFLVTPQEINQMLARSCYLCGTAPSVEVDHIVPLSRGGQHAVGNLLGACRSCNGSKRDKLLIEYRQTVKIRLAELENKP